MLYLRLVGLLVYLCLCSSWLRLVLSVGCYLWFVLLCCVGLCVVQLVLFVKLWVVCVYFLGCGYVGGFGLFAWFDCLLLVCLTGGCVCLTAWYVG